MQFLIILLFLLSFLLLFLLIFPGEAYVITFGEEGGAGEESFYLDHEALLILSLPLCDPFTFPFSLWHPFTFW